MRVIPNLHNFIHRLPEAIRNELQAQSVVRQVSKDQPVYHQGDASTELYQLLDGAIRLCNYTPDGREVIMGEFRSGDVFGEMGLVDGLPRHSYAVASRDSRVRVIPKARFDELRAKHPEINHELAIMLSFRIRLLFEMTEDASVLNLRQRLARIIHRLAHSHGATGSGKVRQIDISQEELARMLGVSRQSVSKELQALQQQGYIAIRYGKLQVLDLSALGEHFEAQLGFEQVAPEYPAGDQRN